MSHNTFGHLFRVTTWGESHGPALGCVVDGCPPGLPLTAADIQYWLNRRAPGTSRFVTQRREPDEVKILSGVFEDDRTEGPLTTGTPISLMIENVDQRGKDYDDIRDLYRPGHADYVYDAKYGLRDYRGGGRSSARETAARVAAGAVARRVLSDVQIRAAVVQIGSIAIDRSRWDCAGRCRTDRADSASHRASRARWPPRCARCLADAGAAVPAVPPAPRDPSSPTGTSAAIPPASPSRSGSCCCPPGRKRCAAARHRARN